MQQFLWVTIMTLQMAILGLGTVVGIQILVFSFQERDQEPIDKIFNVGWRTTLVACAVTWFLLAMSMGGYSRLFAAITES